jgi:hypothetical protein
MDELFKMCLDKGASAAPKANCQQQPDDADVLADLPGPLSWPAPVVPPEGCEVLALREAGAKSFRRQMREVAFRRGVREAPLERAATLTCLLDESEQPAEAEVLKLQSGGFSGRTAHHIGSTGTNTWSGAPARLLMKLRRHLPSKGLQDSPSI